MAIPVKNVRGIGPKTVEYLATKKIKTVEQLLNSKIEVLAGAPGIGVVRAEAAMKAAEKLSGAAPTATDNQKPAKDKKDKKTKDRGKKDKKKDKKKNRKNKKGKKDKKKDKKKNK